MGEQALQVQAANSCSMHSQGGKAVSWDRPKALGCCDTRTSISNDYFAHSESIAILRHNFTRQQQYGELSDSLS